MATKTPHWIFADTTERDTQLDAVEGDIAYVLDTDTVYSFDGAVWNAVGGGAITPINFYEADAPTGLTPGAEDDDFDGPSLALKWTVWDQPANATISVTKSHVKIAKPRVGGINWSGIYQPIPSATFTVVAKVAVQGLLTTDFDMAGLFILGNVTTLPATADLDVLCIQTDNTSAGAAGTMTLALNRYTSFNTFGSVLFTVAGIATNSVYMRARVSGSDISWDYSTDGVAWIFLETATLPQTPEAFGVGGNSHNNVVGAPGPTALVDWVRVIDGTADFDQPLLGRVLGAIGF